MRHGATAMRPMVCHKHPAIMLHEVKTPQPGAGAHVAGRCSLCVVLGGLEVRYWKNEFAKNDGRARRSHDVRSGKFVPAYVFN